MCNQGNANEGKFEVKSYFLQNGYEQKYQKQLQGGVWEKGKSETMYIYKLVHSRILISM